MQLGVQCSPNDIFEAHTPGRNKQNTNKQSWSPSAIGNEDSRHSVSLIRVLLDQTCSISALRMHSICSEMRPSRIRLHYRMSSGLPLSFSSYTGLSNSLPRFQMLQSPVLKLFSLWGEEKGISIQHWRCGKSEKILSWGFRTPPNPSPIALLAPSWNIQGSVGLLSQGELEPLDFLPGDEVTSL